MTSNSSKFRCAARIWEDAWVPPLFENPVKQGGNLRISVKISRKYPKIFAPAARFIQDFDDFWQLRAAGEKNFDVFSSKTPRKRHFYKVF